MLGWLSSDFGWRSLALSNLTSRTIYFRHHGNTMQTQAPRTSFVRRIHNTSTCIILGVAGAPTTVRTSRSRVYVADPPVHSRRRGTRWRPRSAMFSTSSIAPRSANRRRGPRCPGPRLCSTIQLVSGHGRPTPHRMSSHTERSWKHVTFSIRTATTDRPCSTQEQEI